MPQPRWQTWSLDEWYGGQPWQRQVQAQTAVWSHTGLPAVPRRWVLLHDPKGKFQPQALLSTVLSATPEQSLLWCRQRSQVAVTDETVRAPLGVETQRQWSDLALLSTTPALGALFSIIGVFAHQLQAARVCPLPQSAGAPKQLSTFVEAFAWVRQRCW